MRKFILYIVCAVALCMNCQKEKIVQVEVVTRLHLSIEWKLDTIIITPDDLDSVRITIHSDDMGYDRVNSFSFTEKTQRLNDLPSGIDFTILVEGINKNLGVLYLGTAVVSANGESVLEVSITAYALSSPDRAAPVITVLSHSMFDTLASRSFHLFGKIVDPSGLSSLTVNGTSVSCVDNFFDLPGLILQDGRNTFVIRAVDASRYANAAQITFVVFYNPIYIPVANYPPYFLHSAASMNELIKVGQHYNRILRAADRDIGNRLTFTACSLLTLNNDSLISWVPTINDTGIIPVWVLVFDQDSAKDSLAWTITVVDSARNTPPAFVTKSADMSRFVTVGEEYKDTAQASDLEQSAGLVYRLLAPPAGVVVDSFAGIISWRPAVSQVGSHAVVLQVRDDSGATAILSWPITVRYPNITQFSAGRDTTLSIGDTLRLHPIIVMTAGSVTRYEWDIGKTGNYITVSSGDTVITLPTTTVNSYLCALRITNSNNDQLIDEMSVRVVKDSPLSFAGNDSIVLPGAAVLLRPAASDVYGNVVLTEWDIGATGVFTPCSIKDTLVAIPAGDSIFACIFRVTDDDGNISLDTVVFRTLMAAMKYCSENTFNMGSVNGRPDELPIRFVTVRPFYIDSAEITQGRFFEILGVKPSNTVYNPDYPVESVTWFDAVLFCNALSKRYGYDTVYKYTSMEGVAGNNCTALRNLVIDTSKTGYRLPTEAEWESSCRAQSVTEYFWGNDSSQASLFAVYGGGMAVTSQAVGASKMANSNGLYDMAGNVWEWCNDWYGNYTSTEQNNPAGPINGSARVIRGGSWQDNAMELRSSSRGFGVPGWKSSFVGFRTVLPIK